MKRVVTGHDAQGRSVVVSEGSAPRTVSFDSFPGPEFIELWATETTPTLPASPDDPTLEMKSFVAAPGGTRFRLVKFPAESEVDGTAPPAIDPAAVGAEALRKLPGLAESLEPDFRMHTTDTVDYGLVMSGRIVMELDDGRTVHLEAGDCLVQNGTRHGWRNPGPEPCVVAFIMIGAQRPR